MPEVSTTVVLPYTTGNSVVLIVNQGAPGGVAPIDDTTTGTGKLWSSTKVAAQLDTYVTWDGTNLNQGGSAIPIAAVFDGGTYF